MSHVSSWESYENCCWDLLNDCSTHYARDLLLVLNIHSHALVNVDIISHGRQLSVQ